LAHRLLEEEMVMTRKSNDIELLDTKFNQTSTGAGKAVGKAVTDTRVVNLEKLVKKILRDVA
jgi:hypothetical protein